MYNLIMNSPIKPTGTYLYTNNEGYLVPEVSAEKIQQEYKPALEDMIHACKKHYEDNLHSVYVRGSIAKGAAIPDVSDVDGMIVLRSVVSTEEKEWLADFRESMKQKYPFITKFEMAHYAADSFIDFSRRDRVVLKLQSLCLYGTDIRGNIENLKPGKETVLHAHNLNEEVENLMIKFDTQSFTDANLKNWCSWIMKRILRTGHELVAERSQRFTRDLYRCWEGFAEYYPEKKDEMYHVLDLAINPTTDIQKISKTMASIGGWLEAEIPLFL